MTTIASQITSLTVVYSTVYSDAYQRKHQSSASLAFVWGIHRGRWIPRTKDQLRGKCFHLMTSSCSVQKYKAIGQLKWIIWKNEISRDLILRYVSEYFWRCTSLLLYFHHHYAEMKTISSKIIIIYSWGFIGHLWIFIGDLRYQDSHGMSS